MAKFLKIAGWVAVLGVVVWTFSGEEEAPVPPGVSPVKFAIWGGVAEQEAWKELVDDFHRRNPDVRVKAQMVPGQYEYKMLAMLAAGTAPDVLILRLADFVPKGVFEPLDERISRDTTLPLDDLFPGTLSLGRWRGRHYAIPSALGPQVLFYNVKHFEEAGLESPNDLAARGEWDWAKFLEDCKRLTRRDASGKVVRWAYVRYTPPWTYPYLFGGQPFNDDFTATNFSDPRVYGAIQAYADLSLVHNVMPPPALQEQMGGWQAFARGQVSMFISGPWQVKRLKDMPDPYDIAPPPMSPGGRTITLAGVGAGIWVRSKHKEATYRWLSYLAGPEARRIWARLGFDLPAYRSLAEHPETWADTTITPKHFRVFYDLTPDLLRTPPATSPYIPARAEQIINAALDQVWLGHRTVKEALTEVQPEVDEILKKK
ncbi:MAG: sugar ABC transporter substrate-binding protein [Candidatus Latescibacteria bacterium]|nr:sugar ABC transporter substrate-binding protein [Candidatus Latescibacterota bacterium]